MFQDNEHIVRSYDEELSALANRLAAMGELTTNLLDDAMRALIERDAALAKATVAKDGEIDELERKVEEQVILTIAKRQPMAQDLRQVMAAIRIAADLERIGDMGKNIAKRALAISAASHPDDLLRGIEHMHEMGRSQLKDVLEAYLNRDADKALEVWRQDAEIDAKYNALFRELLTYMMEDPRNIGLCTHLLFCAKNIERIGDHTTNIAETIAFLVNGEPIDGERPKKDVTSQTPFTGELDR